ncbi:hypothetical protein VTJ04DRAFT_8619 [Mycothermus thermophilus]|uniref:uncharacterized protein n=1 Tax=Humicola insolens TaxID=85995 RepID=UPI003744A90D
MSNPDPKASGITTIQAKPLIAPSEIRRLFDEKMKELEQLLEAAEEARKQGNEEKAQDLVALLEFKQMESQELMAKHENVIELSSHMSQQFGRILKEILQRM